MSNDIKFCGLIATIFEYIIDNGLLSKGLSMENKKIE